MTHGGGSKRTNFGSVKVYRIFETCEMASDPNGIRYLTREFVLITCEGLEKYVLHTIPQNLTLSICICLLSPNSFAKNEIRQVKFRNSKKSCAKHFMLKSRP